MLPTNSLDFKKLVAYVNFLDEKILLKKTLLILIDHIKESERIWNKQEIKRINISFFSEGIRNKLLGRERLFLPFELSEIISHTLDLLYSKKNSDEYKSFYKNAHGTSSMFMKCLGVLFALDSFLIAFHALNSALFPAIFFTVLAVGFSLLATLLIIKSYPSSFAKEMGDIDNAFEEYKVTRRLGVN